MQRHPMHPPPAFFLKVASSHCHIASKNITKKKHKKKTTMTAKRQRMQRHPMHLGGGAAPSPQPPSSLFFQRLPPLTATLLPRTSRRKNTRRRQKITKKTTHAKTPMHLAGRRCALPTKNDTKKHTNAKTPTMHLSKNTTERNNKRKSTRCIWGGGASHSHITKKINENKKNTEKTRFPSCIFFVLKLPCLDVETDAKNPRQAGTVAKNPRGTDAKNPPQLAPLQKTPVTV